jgi:3-oxoacyl-[acyl-carrier protein] reductase
MRNVIITGGSRGLGLAMAKRLVSDDYRVIAAARKRGDELAAVMDEAKTAGRGELVFMPLDLAQSDGIPIFVDAVRKSYGEIYGLVNNAGLGTDGVLANMHVKKIGELVQLNTLAPMILTKFVLRSMMMGNDGRIINISSIISFTGYSGLSAYAATKASLIGFTKSLAREVGRIGITVNALAPGFIDTDLTKGLTDSDREKIVSRSALRRLAEPEDVAGTVAFLMGPGGRNITGTVITIDAGNTA